MSREDELKKKKFPDPIYGSETVTKFINKLMQHGKKSIARN